jgi:hypothetical protein
MSEREQESAALWRRWRQETETAADEAALLMRLAAHAEGRLDEAGRGAVEALAADLPELAADVAAAREAKEAPAAPDLTKHDPARYERLVRRAAALVPDAPEGREATVVPFRRIGGARAPLWRSAASWAALAASFVLTGYFGFSLGSDAYSIIADPDAGSAVHQELLDPPGGFFGSLGDLS